jgi:hypothetical protein
VKREAFHKTLALAFTAALLLLQQRFAGAVSAISNPVSMTASQGANTSVVSISPVALIQLEVGFRAPANLLGSLDAAVEPAPRIKDGLTIPAITPPTPAQLIPVAAEIAASKDPAVLEPGIAPPVGTHAFQQALQQTQDQTAQINASLKAPSGGDNSATNAAAAGTRLFDSGPPKLERTDGQPPTAADSSGGEKESILYARSDPRLHSVTSRIQGREVKVAYRGQDGKPAVLEGTIVDHWTLRSSGFENLLVKRKSDSVEMPLSSERIDRISGDSILQNVDFVVAPPVIEGKTIVPWYVDPLRSTPWSSGFPFESRAVWKPGIDSTDGQIWDESMRQGGAEVQNWQVFNAQGRRIGVSRITTSHYANKLKGRALVEGFNELLARLTASGVKLSEIASVRGIHTHGFEGYDYSDHSDLEPPYIHAQRFSYQDRQFARYFRGELNRVGLAHAAFEDQILFAYKGDTVLRKKAFILGGSSTSLKLGFIKRLFKP